MVNEAAKLANYGGSGPFIPTLALSEDFHFNLKAENQAFCKKDYANGRYTAEVVDSAMEDWYQKNCT
ncbi:hypothetical protein ACIBVM_02530 [[Kitasatospora] papulosa]|uniref:hypothetical protein n=1 Tax=[Kitasatospora] papulosa TaxID=1464011 RepID=UPI0037BD016B